MVLEGARLRVVSGVFGNKGTETKHMHVQHGGRLWTDCSEEEKAKRRLDSSVFVSSYDEALLESCGLAELFS